MQFCCVCSVCSSVKFIVLNLQCDCVVLRLIAGSINEQSEMEETTDVGTHMNPMSIRTCVLSMIVIS